MRECSHSAAAVVQAITWRRTAHKGGHRRGCPPLSGLWIEPKVEKEVMDILDAEIKESQDGICWPSHTHKKQEAVAKP